MAHPAILVFLGGGLGAMAREAFMMLLSRDSSSFPMDIFAANMLACVLLGIVTGLKRADRVSARTALLIGTGFTGGMSTFSSFVFGAYSEVMKPGELAVSAAYLLSSLMLGFIAMWAGLRVATRPRHA